MSGRRYSQRAGCEAGDSENKAHCIKEVCTPDFIMGVVPHQCRRKRGHGPNGEYYKQHAKMLKGEAAV